MTSQLGLGSLKSLSAATEDLSFSVVLIPTGVSNTSQSLERKISIVLHIIYSSNFLFKQITTSINHQSHLLATTYIIRLFCQRTPTKMTSRIVMLSKVFGRMPKVKAASWVLCLIWCHFPHWIEKDSIVIAMSSFPLTNHYDIHICFTETFAKTIYSSTWQCSLFGPRSGRCWR